ncbi:MAG: hypothetical protein V8R91_19415 [Butyricimonas faecihominis]
MEPDAVGEEVAHQLNADRFVYDMNTENGYVFVYEKERKRFLYIRGLPAMELLVSRNVLVIRMDLFPWITWVIMS